MSDKPILHYFAGRGKMESIRWALAAVGVEFEEKLFDTKEEHQKLLKSGILLFQQVPMVEIDGMKLVQTRAILSYIAGKYDLYGKDLKERAFIDMYFEATTDLLDLMMSSFLLSEEGQQKQRQLIKDRALNRYYPVFEKALERQEFLVGNKFSIADLHLFEALLSVEEVNGDILHGFPNLKAFRARISEMPTIKKFMAPGSQRKPMPSPEYIAKVKKVFFS